jgi:hypothetical protein
VPPTSIEPATKTAEEKTVQMAEVTPETETDSISCPQPTFVPVELLDLSGSIFFENGRMLPDQGDRSSAVGGMDCPSGA